MYKIYCDDTLIYDSLLDFYVIGMGKIQKELNKSGSFKFSLFSTHAHYNKIQKLKSLIVVKKGDEIKFRGRVISEEVAFNKTKTFTCEGELGFLRDSIQRPFEFTGTPEELLTQLINNHNSQVDEYKRFKVGTVTVSDPNDYLPRSNTKYETTSDNLYDRLLDPLGGCIFITGDTEGNRVINWYADSPYRSDQVIEFGENLLDFTKTNDTEDIATAVIPLGAEVDDGSGSKSRLTIAEVNEGLDYIVNQDAVDLYGLIFTTQTWNDVTVASNLKSKGEVFLLEKIKQSITIELSALDLSLKDKNIDSFDLGDYIQIVSKPHTLDDDYLLQKQSIDLLNPDNDKITLGYSYSSFTDTSVSNDHLNNALKETVEVIEGNYVTNATVTNEVENLISLINQTSEMITSEISANYVLNNQLTESISTLYTQLKDLFEFRFTTLEEVVNGNDVETRAKFEEIVKYIRFVDGNIILGESGNELTLRIENDIISFLEGEKEVAYISNKKLYITDADILVSLRIGNFVYLPRKNGNMSFKKNGG